jgi:hypothetical protein
MLHRARIGVVALGMLGRVQLVRDQHGGDATPVELDRRRQDALELDPMPSITKALIKYKLASMEVSK